MNQTATLRSSDGESYVCFGIQRLLGTHIVTDITIVDAYFDGEHTRQQKYMNEEIFLLTSELKLLIAAIDTWTSAPLDQMNELRPNSKHHICQENWRSMSLTLSPENLNPGKVTATYEVGINTISTTGSLTVDQSCASAFSIDLKAALDQGSQH